MQFVESYREVSRLAPADKKRIQVAELFASVQPLALAEGGADGPEITVSVEPSGLEVQADRDLLEPVLLNVLRNARQATAGTAQPHIRLSAELNRRGNVAIEIADSGPGVPDDLVQKIFVPFFTTRTDGSGVGLALARQVMTAHGGFIRLSQAPEGGALFTLTF